MFGLIYGGVATLTEASAVGGAATIRTTSMIILVMAFAGVLSTSIASLRIPQELAEILAAVNLSKYLVLAILCLIYLVLGFLFDGS